MSTRSIFVVTGRGLYYSPHQTVRVYKHHDGYPTHNLSVLAQATEKVDALVFCQNERLGPEDQADAVSRAGTQARTFADCVIASTLAWHRGFGAQVDTAADTASNSGLDDGLAVYNQSLAPHHFGNQGDLEWVYLVDLPAGVINVYACGESAAEAARGDPTDPRTYADNLVERYRARERDAISAHMDKLMDLGWALNVPAVGLPRVKKARASRAVRAVKP